MLEGISQVNHEGKVSIPSGAKARALSRLGRRD